MTEIEFYNARILPHDNLEEINGSRQSVREIAKRALADNTDINSNDYGIHDDFDPLCRTKSSRWERSFATTLFAITGQAPSRDELKIGRRIIESMPRDIKKSSVDQEFVLGPLAYTVAFQKASEADFQPDANNVQDVARFLSYLSQRQGEDITFNSLLCGHRIDSSIKKNALIDEIPAEKIRRTARLITGIGRNATHGVISQHWYQQQPTRFTSSNMFPTVFKQYSSTGQLPLLFDILDSHTSQINQVFSDETTKNAIYSVKSLDTITQAAFRIADRTPDWRTIDTDFSPLDATLAPIVSLTIDEVARFASSYGASNTQIIEDEIRSNISAAQAGHHTSPIDDRTIIETLQQFYTSLELTLGAKAFYEVCLSQAWGQYNAESGEVAIGIDRDHTQQRPAAYSHGQQNGSIQADAHAPLLYGRRTDHEKPGGLLSTYNVRQFWT